MVFPGALDFADKFHDGYMFSLSYPTLLSKDVEVSFMRCFVPIHLSCLSHSLSEFFSVSNLCIIVFMPEEIHLNITLASQCLFCISLTLKSPAKILGSGLSLLW